MFQVVYEYADPWPAEGGLQVKPPVIASEIQVSPESARRRANSYLTLQVAMEFQPGEPVLVMSKRPIWRVPIHLYLRGLGLVTMLGSLTVDATTREVIPLSEEEIARMRARAHDIATRLTLAAESAV